MNKKLKELEERIQELENKVKYPLAFQVGTGLDPSCLHNGCDHARNPFCHLFCPHCGPTC